MPQTNRLVKYNKNKKIEKQRVVRILWLCQINLEVSPLFLLSAELTLSRTSNHPLMGQLQFIGNTEYCHWRGLSYTSTLDFRRESSFSEINFSVLMLSVSWGRSCYCSSHFGVLQCHPTIQCHKTGYLQPPELPEIFFSSGENVITCLGDFYWIRLLTRYNQ